jgi:hypothetical protein
VRGVTSVGWEDLSGLELVGTRVFSEEFMASRPCPLRGRYNKRRSSREMVLLGRRSEVSGFVGDLDVALAL